MHAVARLVLRLPPQSLPLANAWQQFTAQLGWQGQRPLTKAALGTITSLLSRGHDAAKDVLQAEAHVVRVLPSLGLTGMPILAQQALLQEHHPDL